MRKNPREPKLFHRIIVAEAISLALATLLACCSKEEGSQPRSAESTAASTSFSSPTPTAMLTPAAVLTREDLDKLRTLVARSLAASWGDLFGQGIVQTTFANVGKNGPVAVVRITGLSRLVNCRGTLTTNGGGSVPNNHAVIAQFGAFELSNLSSRVFSELADVQALELQFTAKVRDKYGNSKDWKFFRAVITREQAGKMNWRWFRGTILQGGFDPTAFEDFTLYFGDPPSPEDMGLVMQAIRETSERAAEAYGSIGGRETALTVSAQMANWSNCF